MAEGKSRPMPIDDQVAMYLEDIENHFSDVFSRYHFVKKTASPTIISFENKNFEIIFGYEYGQYPFMQFNGVGILVKRTRKEYGLEHIIGSLKNDIHFNYDKEFYSIKNAGPAERIRILWNDYIDETLRDPEPAWEKLIPDYMKHKYPNSPFTK